MPSIPATPSLIEPETERALTELLNLHLRSHGVVLDETQIRAVKQQGPVIQFLHAVVDLGRRQLQEAQKIAEHVVAPATSPTPPPQIETASTMTTPASTPHGLPSRAVIPSTADAKRWAPPDFTPLDLAPSDFTAPDYSLRAMSEPVQAPEVLPLRGEDRPLSDAAQSSAPADPPKAVQPAPPASPAPDKAGPSPVTSDPPPAPPKAAPPTPPPPPPPPPKPIAFPKLRIPNGTADTPYNYSFDLSKNPELASYRLTSIAGLEGIGLSFDPEASRIHGTPQTEAGKSHEFTFLVTLAKQGDESGKTFTTDVILFINPHPRSLWKEIDPDPTLEFQKPHKRSADHHSGGLRAAAASVRGRSHANSGTFREDDFHIRADSTGNWTVVAVSDGAGSAKYSRRGSQIATEQSVELLAAALPAIDAKLPNLFSPQAAADSANDPKALEGIRHALFEPVGRAAFAASKAIQAEAAKLKVEEKLLSATLLVAAVRPYEGGLLVAAYWVGDGAAAIFDPDTGTLHLLGDADAGEYSGQTRFLLSSEFGANAWDSITKRFRCRYVPAGSTVILMTDGVSDPKFGTDNSLRDPGKWLSWWRDDLCANVNLSRENVMLPKDLEAYLGFWSQGEHDDRTLALVY